jgi:hypothetical protein
MIGYGSVIMPILVAISALGSLSCHIMTSSRLCFVGARQGHIPDCLSLVTLHNYTPTPALVFLVNEFVYLEKSIVLRTVNATEFLFLENTFFIYVSLY